MRFKPPPLPQSRKRYKSGAVQAEVWLAERQHELDGMPVPEALKAQRRHQLHLDFLLVLSRLDVPYGPLLEAAYNGFGRSYTVLGEEDPLEKKKDNTLEILPAIRERADDIGVDTNKLNKSLQRTDSDDALVKVVALEREREALTLELERLRRRTENARK
ncbi:hypothetical protein KIPB_010880, partial [Kipferlia bialata]|eukprot:g10880.t1